MSMHATNTLSLSTTSGHPGDEVTLCANLANTDATTALELKISLGEYLQYVDGSCTLNSIRSNGHILSASVSDNVLKVYVYSMGLKALNGTSGELLQFKLKLGNEPADYVLSPEVVLSSATGQSLACNAVAGTVQILSPKIEIENKDIDFGRVPIRDTYTQTLTIRNVGNEPLIVSDIAVPDARIQLSEQSLQVNAGATKDISLIYSPEERETIYTTATIYSNAINDVVMKERQTASISAVAYSVNELHIIEAGGISDEIVTIWLSMDNMEPIVAIQAEITLPDALEYVSGSAKVSERGANHQVVATSENGKLSLYAYSLANSAFSGNTGNVISFDVKLVGGYGSYMLTPDNVALSTAESENLVSAVTGNYVTIQSPEMEADDKLQFGDHPITEEATADYCIKNIGQADLTVDKVLFLAEGYEATTALPIIVKAGKTGEITVKYTPTVAGDFGTTMQLYSNDPEQRMKSIAVSGHIYEPNELSVTGKTNEDDYSLTISLDNYSEVVAIQFMITGLVNTTFDNKISKTARLANHSVSVTDMGNNSYLVLVYSFNNSVIAGHEGELMTISFDTKKPTQTTVSLDGIVISSKNNANINTSDITPLEAEYGEIPIFGDVDDDRKVTIVDVTKTIRYITNPTNAYPDFSPESAVLNVDGKVDINDVVIIINKIVNK